MGEMIEVATLDGNGGFQAYCARPAREATAAIIVIQEIFGVNKGIRAKCDNWAAAGYLALAPDLFWRLEPGIELDPDVPEQFQEALGWMGRFDQDRGIADIEATIHAAQAETHGKRVGCVGFCLGGRLAFMTAARTDIHATVGYYGIGIDGLLGEKHAIAHPVLLHVPTADHFVGPEAQRSMHEGLDDHPKVTLHDYAGLDHGFATEFGARRNDSGAKLADSRTAAFFAEHLA